MFSTTAQKITPTHSFTPSRFAIFVKNFFLWKCNMTGFFWEIAPKEKSLKELLSWRRTLLWTLRGFKSWLRRVCWSLTHWRKEPRPLRTLVISWLQTTTCPFMKHWPTLDWKVFSWCSVKSKRLKCWNSHLLYNNVNTQRRSCLCSWKYGSLVPNLASLVALWADSSPLVMPDLALVTCIFYYATPSALRIYTICHGLTVL